MLKTLEYSIIHFFEHILQVHMEPIEELKGEFYGSSISVVEKSGREYNFYLFFSTEFLHLVSTIFIGEEDFQEDDRCDLVKECANQIVGYAKKLLNDAKGGDDEYKLGIPEYLGRIHNPNIILDQSLTYGFKDYCFRIGYCQ
ncbi:MULTISPECIES: chemotaxis protein CheX [Campylobacter]|uniref:Chemotaxis phosphatase CheX-like domain-containing protein n=1 Tax=Campylobacter taeniopygiae TaxID=2510188 RepID=A0ABY2TKF4_9BACT|nr:chemotaxis protein CheX [Campylobacter taeniopygiae]MBZ7963530.1 hypothetical protein [Campylobacter sp. 2457A]TKX34590.1 hypothetical protein CQA75_01375 [Campylobacter taeniopygiae]